MKRNIRTASSLFFFLGLPVSHSHSLQLSITPLPEFFSFAPKLPGYGAALHRHSGVLVAFAQKVVTDAAWARSRSLSRRTGANRNPSVLPMLGGQWS